MVTRKWRWKSLWKLEEKMEEEELGCTRYLVCSMAMLQSLMHFGLESHVEYHITWTKWWSVSPVHLFLMVVSFLWLSCGHKKDELLTCLCMSYYICQRSEVCVQVGTDVWKKWSEYLALRISIWKERMNAVLWMSDWLAWLIKWLVSTSAIFLYDSTDSGNIRASQYVPSSLSSLVQSQFYCQYVSSSASMPLGATDLMHAASARCCPFPF